MHKTDFQLVIRKINSSADSMSKDMQEPEIKSFIWSPQDLP